MENAKILDLFKAFQILQDFGVEINQIITAINQNDGNTIGIGTEKDQASLLQTYMLERTNQNHNQNLLVGNIIQQLGFLQNLSVHTDRRSKPTGNIGDEGRIKKEETTILGYNRELLGKTIDEVGSLKNHVRVCVDKVGLKSYLQAVIGKKFEKDDHTFPLKPFSLPWFEGRNLIIELDVDDYKSRAEELQYIIVDKNHL